MIRHIVVGVDDTPHADDALALAIRLASVPGGSLALVSVSVARADEVLAIAAARVPDGIPVTCRPVARKSPAHAISHVAAEIHADAIVLGASHARRDFPWSSTTPRVLHDASCAVAVAPEGFAARAGHRRYGLVVAAYNGSGEAREAVRTAASLAAESGVDLRIVTVVDLPEETTAPSRDDVLAARTFAAIVVRQVSPLLRALVEELELPDARTVILQGTPAAVLRNAAAASDLLVLGSRAYGPLRRAVLGSVSAPLATHPPCPVLVVPRGVPAIGSNVATHGAT